MVLFYKGLGKSLDKPCYLNYKLNSSTHVKFEDIK